MKAVLWTVFVLFALFAAVFLIIQGYRMDRDIDSMIDRAQVAADRDDMLQYTKQLETNMEYWSMTEGHTAIMFKNPRNDMALHYKAVQKIIDRLESIKELPKNETAYQVALNDLRGTIRELPNPAMGWLWVCYGWWFLLIGIVLLIIAWVASRDSFD
jgi:Ni/Co efflux regulator RcnB